MTEPRKPGAPDKDKNLHTAPTLKDQAAQGERMLPDEPDFAKRPKVITNLEIFDNQAQMMRVFQTGMGDLTRELRYTREELRGVKDDVHEVRGEVRTAVKRIERLEAGRASVPPPEAPQRSLGMTTGQHAVVTAKAALEAAAQSHVAVAALSVDYEKERARSQAEMMQNLAAMSKDARAHFGKWAAVGAFLFAIISAIGGAVTAKIAADQAVKEAPKVQNTPNPGAF